MIIQRTQGVDMKPFAHTVAQALIATMLSGVALASQATTIDFSAGVPTGATLAGNTLTVGSYQFTEVGATPSVSKEGKFQTYGLSAPMQGSAASLSVSRVDGQAFSITEIDPFVAGTLVTGAVDFELTPFDAKGIELAPVALQAGQFQTNIAISAAFYPTLSNITSFKVSNSLIDHDTRFAFTSASDTPAVPEPSATAMSLIGILGLAWACKRAPSA
jgi:hypothetical protein